MLFEKVILRTNKLPALISFYENVMDLPVTRIDGKEISIIAGASELVFQEAEFKNDPYYHFAFNIPSNKFDEAFAYMEKRVNLLFLESYHGYIADFASWNAKSFYFLDPAGNILELISRFELNDNTDQQFSTGEIRNISEIGLVIPLENFDEEDAAMRRKFGLEYFSKQPPLPQFRAIGNDEGLLIIVPENRDWFSSNKPSAIFPLEIYFENKGKNYVMTH